MLHLAPERIEARELLLAFPDKVCDPSPGPRVFRFPRERGGGGTELMLHPWP